MKDFETYAACERLDTFRKNAARKLTRQQRAQRRRFYRRTSAVFLLLTLYALCFFLGASLPVKAAESPVQAQEAAPMETHAEAESTSPAPSIEPQEDFENERIEDALLARAHVIEGVTVTHYDCCVECCGKDDGITASGVLATPGVTVAVDPSVIPLGSDVLVDYGDGEIHYYRADDTGGAVKGNHIDLCVATHEEALQLGRQTATVYWCEE